MTCTCSNNQLIWYTYCTYLVLLVPPSVDVAIWIWLILGVQLVFFFNSIRELTTTLKDTDHCKSVIHSWIILFLWGILPIQLYNTVQLASCCQKSIKSCSFLLICKLCKVIATVHMYPFIGFCFKVTLSPPPPLTHSWPNMHHFPTIEKTFIQEEICLIEK